jgi:hypothetical protein
VLDFVAPLSYLLDFDPIVIFHHSLAGVVVGDFQGNIYLNFMFRCPKERIRVWQIKNWVEIQNKQIITGVQRKNLVCLLAYRFETLI